MLKKIFVSMILMSSLMVTAYAEEAAAKDTKCLEDSVDFYWHCNLNAQDKASKGNFADMSDQRCEKKLVADLEKCYGIIKLNKCQKDVVEYYYNCQERLNDKYVRGNLSAGRDTSCVDYLKKHLPECDTKADAAVSTDSSTTTPDSSKPSSTAPTSTSTQQTATPMQSTNTSPLTDARMVAMISQPPQKLIACAKRGVLAYQTALSLNYVFGRDDLPKSYTEAYAWSLIVGHRLAQTNNLSMMLAHQHVEALLREKIHNRLLLKRGKRLATKIWNRYGKAWGVPQFPEQLPSDCRLG